MLNIFQLIMSVSGIITAIIALTSFIHNSKRQREIEKNSMYQRLELASIEFFKWEASNRKELRIIKEKCPDITDDEDKLLETYCTQALNLFELCIHNENTRMLPDKVFGSWIPWIYDFIHEPGIIGKWNELRLNYTPECREIIERAIRNNNREDLFIIEMCDKHHLKKEDWIEYETE